MNNMNSDSGANLFFIVFIVFFTLKLAKVITWSWWWVTAPLWVPYAVFVIIFFIGVLISIGNYFIRAPWNR